MTKITKQKCDQCGKETDDRYCEPGWIHINDSSALTTRVSISMSIRRNERGHAKTAWVSFKEIDFCCMSCLTRYLSEIYNRELKRLGHD